MPHSAGPLLHGHHVTLAPYLLSTRTRDNGRLGESGQTEINWEASSSDLTLTAQ